ncbi:hypothetical protein H4J50_08925 [Colwellia sp. 6M3]|jgi:hypothetical protein|nr:hypothetical protein [Colwellia sp. 6M3]MBA6416136.1 hypothetical protein [Colwellia sp. 6M3]
MKAKFHLWRLMSVIVILSALFAPFLLFIMTGSENFFGHYNHNIWSSYQ